MTEKIFNHGRAKLRMLFRQMHALVEAIDKPKAKDISHIDMNIILEELIITLIEFKHFWVLRRMPYKVAKEPIPDMDVFAVFKLEPEESFCLLPKACNDCFDALTTLIRKISNKSNSKLDNVKAMKALELDKKAKYAREKLGFFLENMVWIPEKGGESLESIS